ncbi:MAG: hypothetical protein SFX73_17785 [Kofleriaceae bacterium]|nr:hypothetical protein [Kofleriaceae bacterium]
MSASRPSSASKSSRPARRSRKKTRPTTAADLIPWHAISELAEWALDLAERDVADWPVAHRRVRNTRRYVLARIDGKNPNHAVSVEDITFTAALLARILEEQFSLGYVDTASVLEDLELPIDDVPVPMYRPRNAAPVDAQPATSFAFRTSFPTPPPLRFCDECGYVHAPGEHIGYRNAA